MLFESLVLLSCIFQGVGISAKKLEFLKKKNQLQQNPQKSQQKIILKYKPNQGPFCSFGCKTDLYL